MITLQDFCLESWKGQMKHLLINLRSKYDSYIIHNKKHANYDAVAKLQDMFGAFHEVSINNIIYTTGDYASLISFIQRVGFFY